MRNTKVINIHKALNNWDFQNKVSLINEDSKLIITVGTSHSNKYSIVEADDFTIGINHEIGGPYPIVNYATNEKDLYIGVDNNLFLISICDRKVIWHIVLDTPFVGIHLFKNNSSILVIEECGVSKWAYKSKRDWSYGTDLITSFKVLDGKIVITQMDSPELTLSLQTGKPVPN
ncbi:MAG: hypothetical protein IPJ71_11865 [Bdellovibrionales bacterium]|nr:hypothetical protein [Bdellovibrionales bacterium]